MNRALPRLGLYALAAVIVLYSVFPFYYAIVSSLKTGQQLFDPALIPPQIQFDNYIAVLSQGVFLRDLLNSVVVAVVVVAISLGVGVTAAYALGRVNFRGRKLLLLSVLGVSMFPQVAVLSGLFELIRALGLYNSLPGLMLSYLDLHPALHGVGADDLHPRTPQGARRGRHHGRRQPLDHHPAGVPAAALARARHHGPARLHRRLERVPLRADVHAQPRGTHRAGGDRAPRAAPASTSCPGAPSWRPPSS